MAARLGVALALLVLVTACGWHLRGAGQGALEGQRLAVQSEVGEGELLQLTRQSLRRFGAEVVNADAEAPMLVLLGNNTRRRTIETDDDGRARAWELTYRLSFMLRPAATSASGDERGAPLIRTRTVRASDTYEAAPRNVQAEQAQRERIRQELRDEALRLMLSQVASALES